MIQCVIQVLQVRETVKNASNDQIILVLQYYENDVERTVAAFLEGCTVIHTLRGNIILYQVIELVWFYM